MPLELIHLVGVPPAQAHLLVLAVLMVLRIVAPKLMACQLMNLQKQAKGAWSLLSLLVFDRSQQAVVTTSRDHQVPGSQEVLDLMPFLEFPSSLAREHQKCPVTRLSVQMDTQGYIRTALFQILECLIFYAIPVFQTQREGECLMPPLERVSQYSLFLACLKVRRVPSHPLRHLPSKDYRLCHQAHLPQAADLPLHRPCPLRSCLS